MLSKTTLSHIALIIVNVIYAASFTITKEISPSLIGPAGFIFMRVSGAILAIFLILLAWKKFELPKKQDIPLFFVCGFFGVAINMLMFFQGLVRTSPINASLIMVTTPLLVLIISIIFKGEKFKWFNYIGFIIGTIGAATLIVLKPSSIIKESSVLGDLFIFINASSYAIYLVLVKNLMKKYPSLLVTFYCFCFGILMIIPFAWKEVSIIHWGSFVGYPLFCLLFVILATTVITYTFNSWALQYTSSTVVGAYIYLQPVLGTGIALMSGKYSLTMNQIILAFVIMFGVFLSTFKGERKIVLQE